MFGEANGCAGMRISLLRLGFVYEKTGCRRYLSGKTLAEVADVEGEAL